MTKPAQPKNHLAAIHIAFKAMGISKDDACALKLAVTGQASAANMTEQQRKRLLARLAEMQADRATQRGETPAYTPKRPALYRTVDDDQDARWAKARVLWAALATAGHVHHDTDAALQAWVKRQTHMEHWRFLNSHQITTVIESLKRWCKDKGVPTEAPIAVEHAHG